MSESWHIPSSLLLKNIGLHVMRHVTRRVVISSATTNHLLFWGRSSVRSEDRRSSCSAVVLWAEVALTIVGWKRGSDV